MADEPKDDWLPVADANLPDEWQPISRQESQGVLPEMFQRRIRQGEAIARVLKRAGEGIVHGFGEDRLGFSDQTISQLQELGIYHDPARGYSNARPFALFNEVVGQTVAPTIDALFRGVSAGVHGAGGLVGQIIDELGGSGTQAERETINFGNFALIEAGFGRFSRPAVGPKGEPFDHVVGTIPRDVDFKNAADAIGGKPTEANLRRLWEENGVHPAEAANDAANDVFLRKLLTEIESDPALKLPTEAWSPEALAAEGEAAQPRPLGAAVNTDPPLVPLAEQPAPPPGRLMAGIQSAADKLVDIGHNIQMLVAPMARGTTESMAAAKDFANALRRNRWEWSRIDDDVAKRFTPEQRKRMWDAADEESVARQLGESREHQGLVTLEPAERAAVEDLQARAQTAWLKAVDLGMVEGDGLPAYTPRMILNVAAGEGKSLPLNVIGRNLFTRTAQMRRRKYLTAEETEAAAKAKYGEDAELARDIRVLPLATARLEDAIAGRQLIENIKDVGKRSGEDTVSEGARPGKEWFTLDHPAFRTWRPKFEREGNFRPVTDAEGNIIYEQVPIYVRADFEGPLRAVLDHESGALYGAMMSLKGKTMSLIMNSPLIHNAVEWGRAIPAMPGKVATFKIYFEGNAARRGFEFHGTTRYIMDWMKGERVEVKGGSARMAEAIDNGLVPIGKRFFNQDITSIMEAPDLTPGRRSWTAKVLAAVPGLFDEGAGVAVKRAVDKTGDFWHNTLLWDRVADLQMGLYVNFQDSLMAKGLDRQTASRVAAHWANRYAGALPKEAMSDAATKIANFAMFSRSFTMGNLGVIKDMLTGLPKDVLAQIERDAGFRAGSIEAGIEAGEQAKAAAKSIARRKAISIVALDIGLMYVMNSLLQNMANVIFGDSTAEKELHGYTERLLNALQERREHPLKLLQPFDFLESLSATSENEPGLKDRIKIGHAKDGTAIYARNPVGKIGEEFIGYMTGPLDMMRRKQGTIMRPAWQIMSNDAGFGRKVYDPTGEGIDKYVQTAAQVAKHMFMSQFPEGQIRAAADLVKGEGDSAVNAAQAFGPVAGVTFRKGAPGGEAIGELYHARQMHDVQVQMQMPDIRRQIQRGDVAGAMERMTELGIPPGLQRFYLRTTLNPATRLSPKTLKDFYFYSTPEQRERLERAR